MSMFSKYLPQVEDLRLRGYVDWMVPVRAPWKYDFLLPREALAKWLYAFFLKTALPVDRSQMAESNLVYSPLNLTMFLRLLMRLWQLAYPAHWLATVLANIIGNTVVTSARYPKSVPLAIDEVQKVHPLRKISTAPFTAELSTLTAIFQPAVPFGIISSSVARVDAIHECVLDLSKLRVQYRWIYSPSIAIVFFNQPALVAATDRVPSPYSMFQWRSLFDDDGNGRAGKIQNLRDGNLALWSTFEWNKKRQEVKVWMRDDFTDKLMQDPRWCVGLLRTDNWILASETASVRIVLKKGHLWN